MRIFLRIHWKTVALLTICLLIFLTGAVWAQAAAGDYRLNVRREFGYNGGDDIRGNFGISVIGDLSRVSAIRYEIDEKPMATQSSGDFSYSFKTSDYANGWHTLNATLTLKDGSSRKTDARRFQFVDSSVEFGAVQGILLRIGGILLILLLVVGGSVLLTRGKFASLPLGAPRTYGFNGGGICARCGRPFSLHFWAAHFGTARFDRCDYCGHWAMVTRRSPAELQAAERAEVVAAQPDPSPAPPVDPQEEFRRKVDQSRYMDE